MAFTSHNLSSKQSSKPVVQFTVVSGPDLGKQGLFDQERITIGRDLNNDFILSDGFVSNWHGELVRESSGYIYYDLRSRHGSLVLINDVSINLHDSQHVRHVRVVDGSEIQVGSTLIRLEMMQPKRARSSSADRVFLPPESAEKYITAAHRPVKDWTRAIASTDQRLDIFFRLAGQLNGLTRIEDVLDLIVEATFEAFPAANFFAISMTDRSDRGNALTPFITRKREGSKLIDSQVILSNSILQRVVETRESVLFVRDQLGNQAISHSILEAQITACLCAPLVGQRSLLGVMQVDTRGGHGSLFGRQDLDLFSVLASNAAFAIERAQLTEDIYKMFEGFVRASVKAIESRDPTTAGHSERVAQVTMALAQAVNMTVNGRLGRISFNDNELTELRYAALLHDFGKVGVREDVLTKAARINDTQMDVIIERFSNFKGVYWRHHAERLFDTLASQGRGPDKAELAQIKASHQNFCEVLDEHLITLDKLRGKRDLEDAEVEQIRLIGAVEAPSLNGQSIRLLTDDELANLTIAKSNLNEQEWENMRSHAAKSQAFLEQIPWNEDLRNVPCFAGAHHEKLDGSGYPLQLQGDDIPIQVRIMTIADIFDALTASDRPYKRAMSTERASDILHKEARGGQLDLDLVDLFIKNVIPTL